MSPEHRAETEDQTALHARLRWLDQENARLIEEQWTRQQETRALTGIGRLLSERLDPDVVGERIAESLRSLLGGGSEVVYRLDDVQYTSDPYHAFIAEPGAMLGNRMAEWLDRAGPFKTVAQPGSARPARYVLEATVAELYGDFREGKSPAAVLTVQFALIDQGGARPRLMRERTFTSRVDLPQATPDALVRGYGKALAEILSQLVPELGPENGK